MAASAGSAPIRVLVADDQPDVLMALRLLLKGEGFLAEAVSSPDEILRAASARDFDLILMDLNYSRDTTSGDEGLDLLHRLRQLPETPPTIVMTAWSSLDLAVEAMRRGAVDFVAKPWDNARLVSTLRKNLRQRRSADELTIARKVQSKLFPQTLPALAALDYAGLCVEAGPVGGDYFDYLDLGPGLLGLVLADVCGKGMGAALLMANLQATLRSHLPKTPAAWPETMAAVNQQFFENTAPEHFATVVITEFDNATRRLRYLNCGHNPPLLLRAGGTVEKLDPTTYVVGAFRRLPSQVAEVQLHPGDWLLLFSDGIVEAQAESGEMYGEERLITTALRHRQSSAPGMLEAVRTDLDHFASPAGRDDWTLVAARVR